MGRGGGRSAPLFGLTGDQSIDSGTIDSGETVVFGVYDQMGIPFLDEEQSCLDFVKERVEAGAGKVMGEAPQEAMKMLKQFQFPRNRWPERVSMLSGGERRRLQLLSVLAKRPNFLILDEPTNVSLPLPLLIISVSRAQHTDANCTISSSNYTGR